MTQTQTAGSSYTGLTPRVPNRWIALVVLSLAQLMVILDSTIVNIALPSAQRDLGFSAYDRQWVVTGYALAFGSLLLLGGRLSDLFGRRRVFIIGVVGFAVASAVGGAASGIEMLLVARVAQGAFAAMLAPAALSMVSVTFADDATERGRAFGIFGAVSGAGGALGLLLGGVLAQEVSWRWCLYVNLVIAALALVGALLFVRDGGRSQRSPLDLWGTVTAMLGLVGLVYGLGNAASKGWSDPLTVASVLAGVAMAVVFVLVERHVTHPLLPLSVVLDRDRGAAYLAVGISGLGSFAVFLFLTYYLAENLGFSPIQTGIAFLPMVAMIMVGAIIAGAALMPRTRPRPLVTVGCLLGATGMALLTGISTHSTYVTAVLPALLVMGFGFGLIFGPAQNAATSGVTSHETGVASAMVHIAQQVGGSIGLAVFSSLSTTAITNYLHNHAATAHSNATLVDATLASYHFVFWIAAALLVAGALLSALLFRSGPLPISTNPRPAPQTTAQPASEQRSTIMRAAQFSRYGGPEVLEIVDLPDPIPGPGQIRIVVHAAGINATESKLRSGTLSFGAELPQTTGRDVAGVVDQVGAGVTGVAVGDRVFGVSDDGAGAAELAVLTFYARIPPSLGFIDAAGLPIALETATRSLDQLEVAAGTLLLVNGASGGIGSTVVQLAVARGARVIGAASAANQNYLRLLGAESVTYGTGFVEQVRTLAPDGVDVALDVAGSGVLPELISLAGSAGNVVTLADREGSSEHGVRFSNGFNGHAFHALAMIGDLIEAGRFWLPVDRTFPLAGIADAHRVSELGRLRGRLVLVVR